MIITFKDERAETILAGAVSADLTPDLQNTARRKWRSWTATERFCVDRRP